MFEAAELGNQIKKKEYKAKAPEVRAELLRLQGELTEAGFPVIIVIAGVEGGGKSETANLLLEWLDARGVLTYAFDDPTEDERQRPCYWRYWMALPPKGKIGILFGSWYTDPILNRFHRRVDAAAFERELTRINQFERTLVREGALILKFWLHLSKEAQKERFEELEKDPTTRWRITEHAWEYHRMYDRVRSLDEHALRETNTAEAPWHVVEGRDERYRYLTVATIIRDAISKRLDEEKKQRNHESKKKPELPEPAPVNVLNRLDLSLCLDSETYEKELATYQARLNYLHRQLKEQNRSLTLVFEGPDAGGKGGAIRRLTAAMDARLYRVISVAAPTQEEHAQHYLWRFWRHIPRHGRVTIYDRSWYGRVLVERLEGFATEEAWSRAYEEINAFEEQLMESGVILAKFWLAVSEDEQLKRFKERETIPYKQFKITKEDWRNREKTPAYEAAACDMIEHTSTEFAPWTLVEGDCKRWARIKVIKTVCERLEEAMIGIGEEF